MPDAVQPAQTIGDLTGGSRSAVYRTDKGGVLNFIRLSESFSDTIAANEWRDLPFSTYSKLSYGLSIAGGALQFF